MKNLKHLNIGDNIGNLFIRKGSLKKIFLNHKGKDWWIWLHQKPKLILRPKGKKKTMNRVKKSKFGRKYLQT